VPNSVTHLNETPIFECCVVRCRSNKKPRGVHSPIGFVTTCDNGVFNGGVFISFPFFFPSLLVDKKLPARIFQHPIFFCKLLGGLFIGTLFFLYILELKNYERDVYTL